MPVWDHSSHDVVEDELSESRNRVKGKVKVKVSIFVYHLIADNLLLKRSDTAMHCQGISQFYLHTHSFILVRNEPYLSLPSQPKLVLIY